MNQLVHRDIRPAAETPLAKEASRTHDPARTTAEILAVAMHGEPIAATMAELQA